MSSSSLPLSSKVETSSIISQIGSGIFLKKGRISRSWKQRAYALSSDGVLVYSHLATGETKGSMCVSDIDLYLIKNVDQKGNAMEYTSIQQISRFFSKRDEKQTQQSPIENYVSRDDQLTLSLVSSTESRTLDVVFRNVFDLNSFVMALLEVCSTNKVQVFFWGSVTTSLLC